MDLSALIFVALAAAWAVYLVPKALKQHEDASAARGVESVSDRLRVLSPRGPLAAPASVAEAVDEVAEEAVEEVVDEYVVEPVRLSPLQQRLRRQAARAAAQRRRRVLSLLLLALVAVVGVAASGTIGWAWTAVPAAVIVAWLVACRLMVRKEVAQRTRVVKKRRTTLADQALAAEVEPEADARADQEPTEATMEVEDGTEEIPAVGVASPGTWEPVPMTLPTYVAKAPASRTVRTIDLDATGVWSSGRNADDSELAREADTTRRAERDVEKTETPRRATGS